MRILTCYYKHKPGGLCKRLYRGITALLQEGHQVHYVSVSKFQLEDENLIYHKLKSPFANEDSILFWLYFIVICPVLCYWIACKYNIQRVFVFAPLYGYIMQPCRVFNKIPLIVFLRADSIKNHAYKNKSMMVIAAELVMEGIGIWRTKLVSVSQHTLDNVVKRHSLFKPSEKLVLYNDLKYMGKGKKLVRSNCINLACVGVVEPRKNHIFLIEAMKRSKCENIKLNIFGDGPCVYEIKKYVSHANMSEKVKIYGWVDMETYWENIDILILPSLHEGVSNSLLEAASNYVPLLASDIPEHREILAKENLFSLENTDDLAAKLLKLSIETDKYLNLLLLAQNKKLVELSFDWDEEFRKVVLC